MSTISADDNLIHGLEANSRSWESLKKTIPNLLLTNFLYLHGPGVGSRGLIINSYSYSFSNLPLRINDDARRYPCLEVNTKHDRKRDLQDQEKLAEIVDRLFPTYCVNGPMRSGKSFLTITQKRWINPTTNASTIVVNNAFYPEVGVNEVELNRNVLTTNKLSSNPGDKESRRITKEEINSLVELIAQDSYLIQNWSQLSTTLSIQEYDSVSWRRQIAVGNLSYRQLLTNLLAAWWSTQEVPTYIMLSEALGEAGFLNMKELVKQTSTKQNGTSSRGRSTFLCPGWVYVIYIQQTPLHL